MRRAATGAAIDEYGSDDPAGGFMYAPEPAVYPVSAAGTKDFVTGDWSAAPLATGVAMEISIRNAVPGDLEAILALNELVVPAVNSLSIGQVQWFHDHAHQFRVAEAGEALLGFLIGFLEGSSYGSDNYRWFAERYERFAYVDRVAVSLDARRFGIASMLYEDLLAGLPGDVPVLTCEVNLRPPNPGSLAFHERLGFEEAGRQETEGGSKEVALLVRRI